MAYTWYCKHICWHILWKTCHFLRSSVTTQLHWLKSCYQSVSYICWMTCLERVSQGGDVFQCSDLLGVLWQLFSTIFWHTRLRQLNFLFPHLHTRSRSGSHPHQSSVNDCSTPISLRFQMTFLIQWCFSINRISWIEIQVILNQHPSLLHPNVTVKPHQQDLKQVARGNLMVNADTQQKPFPLWCHPLDLTTGQAVCYRWWQKHTHGPRGGALSSLQRLQLLYCFSREQQLNVAHHSQTRWRDKSCCWWKHPVGKHLCWGV